MHISLSVVFFFQMKLLHHKILKAYKPGVTSLRDVALECSTDHHQVKRVLVDNGVKISKAVRRQFSDAHRAAISRSAKGRIGWSKGLKMGDAFKLKNLVSHTRFDITYEWAAKFDFGILTTLNRMMTPRPGRWRITTRDYVALVERFHKDAQFLRIYHAWIESGKEHYRMPTFDHINPVCNGGDCDIPNIQVLTWFENRCKNHMTQEEWNLLKSDIASYFI